MQKVYCDVCHKEIKHPGNRFAGYKGKVAFTLEGGLNNDAKEGEKDVCLPCVISALNKEAYKLTKRAYIKKEVVKNVTNNGQE